MESMCCTHIHTFHIQYFNLLRAWRTDGLSIIIAFGFGFLCLASERASEMQLLQSMAINQFNEPTQRLWLWQRGGGSCSCSIWQKLLAHSSESVFLSTTTWASINIPNIPFPLYFPPSSHSLSAAQWHFSLTNVINKIKTTIALLLLLLLCGCRTQFSVFCFGFCIYVKINTKLWKICKPHRARALSFKLLERRKWKWTVDTGQCDSDGHLSSSYLKIRRDRRTFNALLIVGVG